MAKLNTKESVYTIRFRKSGDYEVHEFSEIRENEGLLRWDFQTFLDMKQSAINNYQESNVVIKIVGFTKTTGSLKEELYDIMKIILDTHESYEDHIHELELMSALIQIRTSSVSYQEVEQFEFELFYGYNAPTKEGKYLDPEVQASKNRVREKMKEMLSRGKTAQKQ